MTKVGATGFHFETLNLRIIFLKWFSGCVMDLSLSSFYFEEFITTIFLICTSTA
ncbi:hypothetical protein Syun_015218 [Stephania yunnanensis]|uniref:Uncharacterized protein n=1 Tax=Stephania yunnanensis TaxID=152371 RepID=A0AAP0JMH4_9MAGN